jgi:hypothetical protein
MRKKAEQNYVVPNNATDEKKLLLRITGGEDYPCSATENVW